MRRRLATTASILLGLVLVGCASDGEPSPAEGATVVVDIYSGRENPTAVLSESGTAELAALIDERRVDAVRSTTPDAGLGFRGFVVDLPGETVRILSTAVVLDGQGLRIDDPTGSAYAIVLDDIRGRVDAATLAALEEG